MSKNINVLPTQAHYYTAAAAASIYLRRWWFIQVLLLAPSVYTSAFKIGALLSSRLSTFVFRHISSVRLRRTF